MAGMAIATPTIGTDGVNQAAVPLASLAAGRYLLGISATIGALHTRTLVGFTVK
jgi:hypothetical protein